MSSTWQELFVFSVFTFAFQLYSWEGVFLNGLLNERRGYWYRPVCQPLVYTQDSVTVARNSHSRILVTIFNLCALVDLLDNVAPPTDHLLVIPTGHDLELSRQNRSSVPDLACSTAAHVAG